MRTCLFLSFSFDCELPAEEDERLKALVRTTPHLAKALVHTASAASDPYVKDGPPPALVLQLYFGELPELEAAVSGNGHLHALTAREKFPTLTRAVAAQQAMLVRHFAVPEPAFRNGGGPCCSYLVSYEGEADDVNAWHSHYLAHHTRHMARFPGIRELEVYTRLDWVSALRWPRVNFMQRNKVAFDSALALTEALNSPVRHDMRADFNSFPQFNGPNRHYAMTTRVIGPV